MKTIAKLIATSAVLGIALVPMAAGAVSYYPGYTCYYRDISGSCLNYQNSNPHFLGATRSVSPYGNRRSLHSFNAYEVQQSPWDNRYNNNYYFPPLRYEDDDDDNDYFDDNDTYIKRYYRNDQPSGWKYYYDENDDIVRPYFLEGNSPGYQNQYFEYEHTRVYSTY